MFAGQRWWWWTFADLLPLAGGYSLRWPLLGREWRLRGVAAVGLESFESCTVRTIPPDLNLDISVESRTDLARVSKERTLQSLGILESAAVQGISSGRGWDRTSDPSRVNRSCAGTACGHGWPQGAWLSRSDLGCLSSLVVWGPLNLAPISHRRRRSRRGANGCATLKLPSV